MWRGSAHSPMSFGLVTFSACICHYWDLVEPLLGPLRKCQILVPPQYRIFHLASLCLRDKADFILKEPVNAPNVVSYYSLILNGV